jgi:PadR family transcriptional regulator PadR
MKLENAKAQMRKGILEMCILSIIAEGAAYSSDILERLKTAELIVKEGTLYPLLTRLKNAGLLHYSWQESDSGPPRKYFHITDEGSSFLNDLLNTWGQLVNAVSESTKNYQQQ